MDKKKYFILMPPFLILGLSLLYFLPSNNLFYALLTVAGFWIVYYVWLYYEKEKQR